MDHCQKCLGSLRLDQEFPGLVCQRCGAVYYFSDPYDQLLQKMLKHKASRDGWHHATKISA